MANSVCMNTPVSVNTISHKLLAVTFVMNLLLIAVVLYSILTQHIMFLIALLSVLTEQ